MSAPKNGFLLFELLCGMMVFVVCVTIALGAVAWCYEQQLVITRRIACAHMLAHFVSSGGYSYRDLSSKALVSEEMDVVVVDKGSICKGVRLVTVEVRDRHALDRVVVCDVAVEQ